MDLEWKWSWEGNGPSKLNSYGIKDYITGFLTVSARYLWQEIQVTELIVFFKWAAKVFLIYREKLLHFSLFGDDLLFFFGGFHFLYRLILSFFGSWLGFFDEQLYFLADDFNFLVNELQFFGRWLLVFGLRFPALRWPELFGKMTSIFWSITCLFVGNALQFAIYCTMSCVLLSMNCIFLISVDM